MEDNERVIAMVTVTERWIHLLNGKVERILTVNGQEMLREEFDQMPFVKVEMLPHD